MHDDHTFFALAGEKGIEISVCFEALDANFWWPLLTSYLGSKRGHFLGLQRFASKGQGSISLWCATSHKMANSDSESSIYDEAIEFQLEDEESDDRMLAQLGVVAYHGEPLADHSETPNEENVDVNDPDGLLPETLEARFERQIQVYEW